MTHPEIPVVLLLGPTASGKSDLAMALARRLPAEIVSVDSAQVYRGMDIGTAKASAAERAAVPHHLLDICDPAQSYSAARFAADAQRAIGEIRMRAKVPLLVGGTMLYFRALLHGLSDLPPADAAVRARLAAEAAAIGWPAMHARLAALDPRSASRLSVNDRQRIQRALEIAELSGTPPSRAFAASPPAAQRWQGAAIKLIVCPAERATLHRRIEDRLHRMMAAGLLGEVRRLHARADLHEDLPSIRSVGYRQLWQHLQGACGLDQAVQRAIFASRQLAKRQLTWLRGERDAHRLDAGATDLDAQAMSALRTLSRGALC